MAPRASKRQLVATSDGEVASGVNLRETDTNPSERATNHAWETRFGALEILAVYTGSEHDDGGLPGREFGFVRLVDDVLFGDTDEEDSIEVEWLEEERPAGTTSDELVADEKLVPNGKATKTKKGGKKARNKGKYKGKLSDGKNATDVQTVGAEQLTSASAGQTKVSGGDAEAKPKDSYLLQYHGDGYGYASIGAIICSVSDVVSEDKTGVVKVQEKALKYVRDRLDAQLSDDYDRFVDEAKYPDYTQRMRASGRKRVKVEFIADSKSDGDTAGAGGRKAAKSQGNRLARSSKSPTKPRTSGVSVRKGKAVKREDILQPNSEVQVQPDPFTVKTGKLSICGGDIERCGKELIRAYRSGDSAVFKKLCKGKSTDVHSLYATQSVDVRKTALDYAIVAEDKAAVDLLWAAMAVSNPVLAEHLKCSLVTVSTGKHTSKYADYNRRKVNMSRGGKEGNNAFVADLSNGQYASDKYKCPPNNTHLVDLMCTHGPVSLDFWTHLDKLRDAEMMSQQFASGASFAPVHAAAANNHSAYLSQLLAVAPDSVQLEDSHEANLLHYACVSSTGHTLKYLLDGKGTELQRNKPTRFDKTTPLMWAARVARAHNVSLLCANQDETKLSSMHRAMNRLGYTPLHLAVASWCSGRLETVRALVECGAEVDVRAHITRQNKTTPLLMAAAKGDLEMVQLLVELGANPVLRDKLKRGAVILAAKNGHAHVLSYLLRVGVDANARDTSDNTAAHYAAAYGWLECLKVLVDQAEALPDERNNWATTPVGVALKKNRLACAAYLLQLGERVDVNICDKSGESLFCTVLKVYAEDLANVPPTFSGGGKNALAVPWVVQRMLDRSDLDVTVADAQGNTALHALASRCYGNQTARERIMGLYDELLTRGANALQQNNEAQVAVGCVLKQKTFWHTPVEKLLRHVKHDITPGPRSGGNTLLHLLLSKIMDATSSDSGSFKQMFGTLRDTLGEDVCGRWAETVNDDGYTPVLVAFAAVQKNWTSCTHPSVPLLEFVVSALPRHLDACVTRTAAFSDLVVMATRIAATTATDFSLFEREGGSEDQKKNGRSNNAGNQRRRSFYHSDDSDSDSSGDSSDASDAEDVDSSISGSKPGTAHTQIRWRVKDQYTPHGNMNAFHFTTLIPDVGWCTEMCLELLKAISKPRAKTLLNAKAVHTGTTPLSNLYKLTHTRDSAETSVRTIAQLMKTLCDVGAHAMPVSNPFFVSLDDAVAYQSEPVDETQLLKRITAYQAGIDASASAMDLDESVDKDASEEETIKEVLHTFILNREKANIAAMVRDKTRRQLLSNQFNPPVHSMLAPTLSVKSEVITELVVADVCLDLEIKNLSGQTALFVSVANKNKWFAEALLSAGADANAVSEGETPLTVACALGDLSLVKLMVDNNADVHYQTPHNGTCLHVAVLQQHEQVVQFLLQAGVDVEGKDSRARTALHHAVSKVKGAKQMLRPIEVQLLEAGASVNVQDKYERTPLHYAFVSTDHDMQCDFPPKPGSSTVDPIDLLTAFTATSTFNLSTRDMDNRNILHLAAAVGATVCAISLVERDPTLADQLDCDGNTPLACAIMSQRAHSAILLISKDAGLTHPIHIVRKEWVVHKQPKATQVDNNQAGQAISFPRPPQQPTPKRQIRIVSRETRSPLYCALDAGVEFQSVARYLLARGGVSVVQVLRDLFACGKFQLALKHIRESRNSEELAERDAEGMTLLHRLCAASSFTHSPGFATTIAQALLAKGTIDASATDHRRRTALHVAALYGHVDLVILLVEKYKVNADATDTTGGTALSQMLTGNNPSVHIAACLLTHSAQGASMVSTPLVNAARVHEEQLSVHERFTEGYQFTTRCAQTTHERTDVVQRLTQEKATTANAGDTPPGDADPTDTPTAESTCLIEAVRLGDVGLVNVVMAHAQPTHCALTDSQGYTALHHAVLSRNVQVLDTLLQWNRFDIDAQDSHGRTALLHSVAIGSINSDWTMSQCLLAYGANPMITHTPNQNAAKDDQSLSPIGYAVRANKVRIVQAMLSAKTHRMAKKEPQSTKAQSTGSLVWVRFAASSAVWTLCRVYTAKQSTYHVKVIRDDAEVQTAVELPTPIDRHGALVEVAGAFVRAVDDQVDILTTAQYQALVFEIEYARAKAQAVGTSNSTEDTAADSSKNSLQLSTEHREALNSALSVGQKVFVSECKGLQLHGAVIAHANGNGTYEVQLYRGMVRRCDRKQLRPTRTDLLLTLQTPLPNKASLLAGHPERLLHLCVHPVSFGSYDNVHMLQTLLDCGVDQRMCDVLGRTCAEVAARGSALAKALQVADMDVDAVQDGDTDMAGAFVDLEGDAEKQLEALHSAGADGTVEVVPTVSKVCEQQSVGLQVLKCGQEDTGICASTSAYYDVTLSKVDVQYGTYGKYVFYRMQVIVDPVQKVFILLTNWGRIGEDGLHQETPFQDREGAINEFRKVYKSKTGNEWANRSPEMFERKPKKYQMVRRPHSKVEDPRSLLPAIEADEHLPNPTLNKHVATALAAMLDVKALSAAAKSIGLDQGGLPLGLVSVQTLAQAEQVLTDVSTALDELTAACNHRDKTVDGVRTHFERVAKLTNEFYELMPMSEGAGGAVEAFSRKNHKTALGKAVEMVRVLKDLSVARQVLLGARLRRKELHPLDYAYKALDMHMEVLPITHPEAQCLLAYIDNTSDGYSDMVVNNIFSLTRNSAGVCDPTGAVGNKQLLFHGSKTTNLCGIIKQGLRIAPPDAPRTGLAYGKGVYFADQMSKSLGYSSVLQNNNASTTQPRAYVFVAEVAVGKL
ncbi:hypothetical protein SARC_00417 [Sphaeroforma arctica JP610]|uniref:Poly [ADP-ribose] polymerase n=1 Tax=Sphaeroforma arctica JP610 TaxID=667725 RepID=A0A0L0GGM6_9EUKA|nr:hypothetical protein SARC_00417 [Sphaeroforma arctica JP610]KNC87483.1 hypothetical protein SARC_00417 [Sphaeroforma arctica JP610]|eukprot:XP_014161385.1 hypothetical protein SARC_00417 [Sphaeroforma arctica JP610]